MQPTRRALTLVEMLIIGAVLSVMAMVVVPQFSNASNDSRGAALKSSLDEARAQIRLYRSQHGGVFPIADRFVEQMTLSSRSDSTLTETGTPDEGLGPYLSAIPANPYTGGNTVGSGPVGTSDWFYDEQTGEFRANHDPNYTQY